MELLAHEAAVHVADIDDVDVPGLDPGMGDRLGGGLHDQGFAGLAVQLAEFAVGPTDDAGRHGDYLLRLCIQTYRRRAAGQAVSQDFSSWLYALIPPPGYRLYCRLRGTMSDPASPLRPRSRWP